MSAFTRGGREEVEDLLGALCLMIAMQEGEETRGHNQ